MGKVKPGNIHTPANKRTGQLHGLDRGAHGTNDTGISIKGHYVSPAETIDRFDIYFKGPSEKSSLAESKGVAEAT
jgi:hypothetical protein